jgi:hypothetical protein
MQEPEATTQADDRADLTGEGAPIDSGGDAASPDSGAAVRGEAELPASNGEEARYPYVYAIGRVEPRFPTLSVEKEFAQATGRAPTAGLTDRQALHAVISERENRYLARLLCYAFAIEGLDTYILQPRDPVELDLLIDAIRPAPSPMDVDVVIGTRGPLAPPEMCNGLMVPVVAFDQIYTFDRDSLIKSIPRPTQVTAKQFEPVAMALFERVTQMTDNAGATDEHRAVNYLAVRYPAIYGLAAEQHSEDFSLAAVEVRPSRLSTVHNIVDVIFSYTNRNTDFTERFFVRVDVTDEFPFLVTKLGPYYER